MERGILSPPECLPWPMMTEQKATEDLAVAVVKGLAMDAVQKANSGHPGMPMGMADIAVTLWSRYLTVDPDHPDWEDRDRFVLSNGHGSEEHTSELQSREKLVCRL